MKEIDAILKARSDSLMKFDGVAGVYVGLTDDSLPCIKVMIEKNDPVLINKIPKSLDSFPVEIEVTGRIKPMNR